MEWRWCSESGSPRVKVLEAPLQSSATSRGRWSTRTHTHTHICTYLPTHSLTHPFFYSLTYKPFHSVTPIHSISNHFYIFVHYRREVEGRRKREIQVLVTIGSSPFRNYACHSLLLFPLSLLFICKHIPLKSSSLPLVLFHFQYIIFLPPST